MTKNEFIGKIVSELLENEVSLKIVQKKSQNNYGGWFDPHRKELFCAYKGKYGFEILIHEYNHFRQWYYRREFWDSCNANDGHFLLWLEGDDSITKAEKEKGFKDTLKLERDCEINSIKTIQKYDLPVDLENYFKLANSYLFSHYYARKYREWPTKIMNSKNFKDKMPIEILPLENYIKGIDKSGKRIIFSYEKN